MKRLNNATDVSTQQLSQPPSVHKPANREALRCLRNWSGDRAIVIPDCGIPVPNRWVNIGKVPELGRSREHARDNRKWKTQGGPCGYRGGQSAERSQVGH